MNIAKARHRISPIVTTSTSLYRNPINALNNEITDRINIILENVPLFIISY